jgi:CRISPR-associated protein Csb1
VLLGDYSALAVFAPTSLVVFGAWDSRCTGAKLPRLLEARIDAYGVELRQRNGQYFSAIDFSEEGLLEYQGPKSRDDPRSKAGFRSTPTKLKPGGVELVDGGRIVRTLTVHLAGVHRLSAGADVERGRNLRQYVLGLALAVATAPLDLFLRQGCSLVPPKPKEGQAAPKWIAVHFNGSEEEVDLPHQDVVNYARKARDSFFPSGIKAETWNATPEGPKLSWKRASAILKQRGRAKDPKPQVATQSARRRDPVVFTIEVRFLCDGAGRLDSFRGE